MADLQLDGLEKHIWSAPGATPCVLCSPRTPSPMAEPQLIGLTKHIWLASGAITVRTLLATNSIANG